MYVVCQRGVRLSQHGHGDGLGGEDYADGKGPGPEEPRGPRTRGAAELPVMEGGLEAELGASAGGGARLEEGQSQTALTLARRQPRAQNRMPRLPLPHANDVAENDADSNQEDVEGDDSRCEGTASAPKSKHRRDRFAARQRRPTASTCVSAAE